MNTFKALWRPLTAIAFALAILFRYLGLTNPELDKEIELVLIETMKYFIMIYGGGRTIEKVVEVGKPLVDKIKRITENEKNI